LVNTSAPDLHYYGSAIVNYKPVRVAYQQASAAEVRKEVTEIND